MTRSKEQPRISTISPAFPPSLGNERDGRNDSPGAIHRLARIVPSDRSQPRELQNTQTRSLYRRLRSLFVLASQNCVLVCRLPVREIHVLLSHEPNGLPIGPEGGVDDPSGGLVKTRTLQSEALSTVSSSSMKSRPYTPARSRHRSDRWKFLLAQVRDNVAQGYVAAAGGFADDRIPVPAG